MFDNSHRKSCAAVILHLKETLREKGLDKKYTKVKIGQDTRIPMVVFTQRDNKAKSVEDFLADKNELVEVGLICNIGIAS